MSKILEKIQKILAVEKIDYLLVNSTNKFLVEYNELEENSRYLLTGFSGSTGDALVTKENVFLFVDGRYHIQADLEVDHSFVDVVKLQTGQTFIEELTGKLKPNSILGIFAKKNSQQRIEKLKEFLKDKNVSLKLINSDSIEKESKKTNKDVISLDESMTGMTSQEKINITVKNINPDDAILITDLEEVSYLFNLRTFSKQYSSKIEGKAIIGKAQSVLYIDAKTPVNLWIECCQIKSLENFDEDTKAFNGKIFADKNSINAYDFNLIKDKFKAIEDNPVKLMKSVKTNAELEHYKYCFEQTDKTMCAIRDFIQNNDNISEFDIAQKLEQEFYNFGAKNLSFKSIVAIDKNSALAHYSKSSKDEFLRNGSLVLIDCGAYYEGGLATDITRVFVKGEPDELQKKVYTTVLKAHLHAYKTFLHKDTTGYDIDTIARKVITQNPIEGFEFNHGLGHGIGISVHEMPPNLSKNEVAKTPLNENMCFTIEPGLYNKNHFGIRLENSCYLKNGQINTFAKMYFEKKLIDYSLLNITEKEWLEEFEVK